MDPKDMTNMQLLRALVPTIDDELEKDDEIVKEVKKRALTSEGFKPFEWMKGCL